MAGYEEEDFLMLSGIQHSVFCRRQWALIRIEQLWEEGLRTVEGGSLHADCHDSYSSKSRKEVFLLRGMPVFSRSLGASGECDIVEFRQSANGIPLHGRTGICTVYPVEYKHGEPKDGDIDILQLAAQAICPEEILDHEIPAGAIFYGKTKRRQRAEITEEYKERAQVMLAEMHDYFQREYVPKRKLTKSCNACSLKDLCLPKLCRIKSAQEYLERIPGTEEAGQ